MDSDTEVTDTEVGPNASITGTGTHVNASRVHGDVNVDGGRHQNLQVAEGSTGVIHTGVTTDNVAISRGPFALGIGHGGDSITITNSPISGEVRFSGQDVNIDGSMFTTIVDGHQIRVQGSRVGIEKSTFEGDVDIAAETTITDSTFETATPVYLPSHTHMDFGRITGPDQVWVGHIKDGLNLGEHRSVTIYPTRAGLPAAAFHDHGKPLTVLTAASLDRAIAGRAQVMEEEDRDGRLDGFTDAQIAQVAARLART